MLLAAVPVTALGLVLAVQPASAVDVRERSQPNGDADVCRNFDRQQILQFTGTVDRPGTEPDDQFSGTADLTRLTCVRASIPDSTVNKKWGVGPYTISIKATSDTGDTGDTSASILIH